MAISTVQSAIIISVVLFLGFLVYMAIKDKIFGSEGFEHPASAPLEILPTSYSPPKIVASSGPNPPAQESPRGEVVVHAGPSPRDPLAEEEEASTAEPKIPIRNDITDQPL
jgi:hypothetical protein